MKILRWRKAGEVFAKRRLPVLIILAVLAAANGIAADNHKYTHNTQGNFNANYKDVIGEINSSISD